MSISGSASNSVSESTSTLDSTSNSEFYSYFDSTNISGDSSGSGMFYPSGTTPSTQNYLSSYGQGYLPKTGDSSSIGTTLLGSVLFSSGLLLAKKKNDKKSKS
ncbi:hypothetical protein A5802_002996 [Enterococcus mundtii]|uniref:Gram-positive cocci surface proteins LPxTG domain-containing protein n=2 Tax=Enterococcus mundtii TaxID=53346 RepID=A0A242KUN2_ENTMU|nr:hypothetical protein A5802_002996 [Enterococcus mundtii]